MISIKIEKRDYLNDRAIAEIVTMIMIVMRKFQIASIDEFEN